MQKLNKAEILKVAQRLAYLWHMREVDPRKYINGRFGVEKEDIYATHGWSNEVMNEARKIYYGRNNI